MYTIPFISGTVWQKNDQTLVGKCFSCGHKHTMILNNLHVKSEELECDAPWKKNTIKNLLLFVFDVNLF